MGGYDSRPLTPGPTDTGVSVADEKTVFFQQLALNVEAVSDKWSFNGYGLLPVVDVEQRINSVYQAGALATFGFDHSRSITPSLSASVGSYYQHRNEENVDGIGSSSAYMQSTMIFNQRSSLMMMHLKRDFLPISNGVSMLLAD